VGPGFSGIDKCICDKELKMLHLKYPNASNRKMNRTKMGKFPVMSHYQATLRSFCSAWVLDGGGGQR
jgi:hypothetical protein